MATLKSTIKESDLKYNEPIGHGASGDVYRATWKSKKLGKVEVAAKRILLLKGQSLDEQFGNEVSFLQKLRHPNIIEYYGQVVTSTHVVIVTEYAAKGSLYDYLKDKTHLPPDLKTKWMIQAARGIKYLTENSVLQRDIKSPNILITANNTLKICDFGIAKDLTSTKTTTSEKGTIRWLAPEAFKDQKPSLKADIFALGIILWELETCEEPYKGYSAQQVMQKVGIDDLRPKIPKNCPPALQSLIQQCWDKERSKRPEIDEIISQLDSSLTWHYKHVIDTHAHLNACHWVSHQHLAVCTEGCVDVYEVTTEGSHLAYKLTSEEWRGKYTTDVAVSESMPGSLLVVCQGIPYVYQYPCHEATQHVKKYKIQGGYVNPHCIVANDNTAVIMLHATQCRLVVCSLPNFTHQSHIHTSVGPYDLSITSDYLLVMGRREMFVKPLGDMSQDLCRIESPDGWMFCSVCFRNNGRQIYAACRQVRNPEKGCVYKYTWEGIGKPQYVNTGHVIDGLGCVQTNCISVTSDGLLAVGEWNPNKVKVYSLE